MAFHLIKFCLFLSVIGFLTDQLPAQVPVEGENANKQFVTLQSEEDLWLIETVDGNEFTGSIIEEDPERILLRTKIYGNITIPQEQIKSRTLLKEEKLVEGEYWFDNPHATRYFFGANGYGLKQGEGYYQNTWILFNQVNVGVVDYFSLGGGLVPLFLFAGAPSPVFLTPKFSIPLIKDKLNLGTGVLFMHVVGEGISFGLPYGAITYGSRDSNVSFGGGWGISENGWSDQPTLMLSGMTRVSKKGYLVSENYYIGLEGEGLGIISLGGRSVQKRLAIDYGLVFPVGEIVGTFIAVPWLGITVPFGNTFQSTPELSGKDMSKEKAVRPSIFNDVIGPVMRGPSSSHTAASWRIAITGMQLLNDELSEALIEFDRDGAWASNYREQGTPMGLEGGLLGLDIKDERMIQTDLLIRERGIRIQYKTGSFETDHENTVRISLKGTSGQALQILAVSTGGGMFEIRKFNGFDILIRGDGYHHLITTDKDFRKEDLLRVREILHGETTVDWSEGNKGGLLQINYPSVPSDSFSDQIAGIKGIGEIHKVTPLLPVLSGREREYPFDDLNGMLSYAESAGYSLGKIGLVYESCRSGLPEEDLIDMMSEIVQIIDEGILNGLAGTAYPDRILPQQSNLIDQAEREKTTRTDPMVNRLIANITALMEIKSALHVIVAVPTAGSCGAFGGTIKAFCDIHTLDEKDKIMAYFAGGMAGILFASGPGFSAEELGCQVETGAAATMTAAALVELSGGTASQAMAASSMALQNTLGLVCDPVADRVEVPCLGRNVTAGMNALGASTMALSGFREVIPMDQVLEAVKEVGRSMPSGLRCTGRGGLSISPASTHIKENLRKS